jgi:hypothetical protein
LAGSGASTLLPSLAASGASVLLAAGLLCSAPFGFRSGLVFVGERGGHLGYINRHGQSDSQTDHQADDKTRGGATSLRMLFHLWTFITF